MQELITIREEKGVQLVDARELHRKLGSKRNFADWIKQRIEKYEFIENEDFFLISQICEIKGRGGDRRSVEYHLTITMAKELAMLQDNEMGRKIRRYFIEMEKVARENILQLPAPKIINGIKCISYNYWLLSNGYSLTSGQVRARIKKYPEQFCKTKDGWYMSEAIGQYFLDYRNPKERVEALPFVSPKQMRLFNEHELKEMIK